MMALTRYRPILPELSVFPRVGATNRIARMMDDMLGRELPEGIGWNPPVDVVEEEGELILTMEVPGMKRDDIMIDVADTSLTIKGEKKSEIEKQDVNFRLVERSYGAFERTFSLPRSVDAARIQAEYQDGVLRVHMPKTAQAQGRRVEINAQ
jgi:HSP20 family protein